MIAASANHARDYAAMEDAELVACVLGGEREAFRQIMQRCNQRMFRMVRGVIRDDAEAEDVVQEAYVHGYETLGSFRGESSLATWLTRIALNEAHGRLRRRRDTVDIDDIAATARGWPRLRGPFKSRLGRHHVDGALTASDANHAKRKTAWLREIRPPSKLRCCKCKRLRSRLEPSSSRAASLSGSSSLPRRTTPLFRVQRTVIKRTAALSRES